VLGDTLAEDTSGAVPETKRKQMATAWLFFGGGMVWGTALVTLAGWAFGAASEPHIATTTAGAFVGLSISSGASAFFGAIALLMTGSEFWPEIETKEQETKVQDK
jgi:hypothetical protein